MQTKVRLPQMELTMESAIIAKWLVAEGDRVRAEQPILDVETQKAASEVPSPVAGFVRRCCVKVGETVSANAVLCILTDTADEPVTFPTAEPDASTSPSLKESADAIPAIAGDAPLKASPAARRVARELGVELSNVKGTGPGGRITEDDVRNGVDTHSQDASSDEPWIPLPATRIALIAQMQKSLAEIPQIHLHRRMDVAQILGKTEGITLTHRLIVAVAAALAKHSTLRTIIKNDKMKVEPVSVAVAMDSSHGLVAPVIRARELHSAGQVAAAVKTLHAKAQNNSLRREELISAPFALSNLGMLGVDFFNAFVFHGQTAVLSVGRMTGAESSGKFAWIGLAVDHRVVDGAEAARFLETLQAEIQRQ